MLVWSGRCEKPTLRQINHEAGKGESLFSPVCTLLRLSRHSKCFLESANTHSIQCDERSYS